jgi:hypothetical protein
MCYINLIYLFLFIFCNFSKFKISKSKIVIKDLESDYDYKLLKASRKISENMEHHTVGRYRAFSLASFPNKLSL